MRPLLAKVLCIYSSASFFHDISALPPGHSIIIDPHSLAFCSDLCLDPSWNVVLQPLAFLETRSALPMGN